MSSDGGERHETRVGSSVPADSEDTRQDTLFELCNLIERGWSISRDPDVVHRLAAEHPEMAGDLYEFFADLIASELEADPPPEAVTHTERLIKEWLDSEGHAMMERVARESCGSRATILSPTPPAEEAGTGRPEEPDEGLNLGYMGYLQECTGLEPAEIVRVLELPVEVYMYVLRCPDKTPSPVKDELAERACRHGKANWDRARRCLDERLPKAACRQTPYRENAREYTEMVRGSKMGKRDKQFWLSLAGEDDDGN